MSEVVLYDYWRSSASYRVRIALHSLGIDFRSVPVDLLSRAHKADDYLVHNPQGLVPSLEIDGLKLTQSLSIIEYLDETRDAGFLPTDPVGRQRVRAIAYAIAMDIHPICNLGVASHVVALTGGGDDTRRAWMQKFIGEGLAAVEAMLASGETGKFCHGNTPTMADFCLVPQIYNAGRWRVDMAALPRIGAIVDACNDLPAFAAAQPDRNRPT